MSTPNWARLVVQGRAKAFGVPWSEEECIARFTLGIPAEFIREGCLTLEQYEKAKAKEAKDGVPLERQPKAVIQKMAKDAGIEFTPDAPVEALVPLLKKKGAKNK